MSDAIDAEHAAVENGRVSPVVECRKEKAASPDRSRRERSSDRRRDSRDRGGRRDRVKSPDRSRRDRDRSPDRRRDRSPDRRRRDRSPDRSRRDRSPDRPSRRDRDRSRERSPDRSRRDRDRSPKKDRDGNADEKEKLRERSPPVDREELRRRREIDDLTKDQRTIFVSQLTKKTNEKDLEHFFGAIGKVKNIIMIRDKNTGAHKGFAYVEIESIPNCLLFNNVVPDFQKFAILVKASEAEKNFLAKKDPFSTTYQPDASVVAQSSSGEDCRLYIGNVHISVEESVLRTLLEQFGPTESVKLHKDHLGNSKGFAFVKYLRAESAVKAAAALTGQEFMGRPLKVGPVVDQKANAIGGTGVGGPSAYGPPGADTSSNNWKLDADEGGAGMSLNSSSRAALMAKLGQSAGLVAPAMPMMPQMMPLMPQAAAPLGIPPVGGTPSVNLLLCNMFDPATETEPEWDLDIKEDLLEECSKYGQVEHVHVEKHKPGGIVLLKFATVEAACRAAQSLNGRFFAGRMITASYIDNVMFNSLMM